MGFWRIFCFHLSLLRYMFNLFLHIWIFFFFCQCHWPSLQLSSIFCLVTIYIYFCCWLVTSILISSPFVFLWFSDKLVFIICIRKLRNNILMSVSCIVVTLYYFTISHLIFNSLVISLTIDLQSSFCFIYTPTISTAFSNDFCSSSSNLIFNCWISFDSIPFVSANYYSVLSPPSFRLMVFSL